MNIKIVRTKRAYIGFVVAAILTPLLTGTSTADQAVDASARRVCAGIGQTGPNSQGAFKIDDLSIRRDVNGTVTLKRDGVKLGEIAQNSYLDHTVCFVEVRALISSAAISTSAE
jgi:hypothetical protein